MRDNMYARTWNLFLVHLAERTLWLHFMNYEACHTSIYSIKSQGWQVYF